jgi:hypothetical protein
MTRVCRPFVIVAELNGSSTIGILYHNGFDCQRKNEWICAVNSLSASAVRKSDAFKYFLAALHFIPPDAAP